MRLHGLEDLTLITRCIQQMWHYINWKQTHINVLTSCNSLSLRFLFIALMTSYERFSIFIRSIYVAQVFLIHFPFHRGVLSTIIQHLSYIYIT